ncbi:MAG: preprotein translocase subunit SecG [Nitrospiraceae bacterium]|nr:preprotein translocase subunit SecG [Nitrospiraceae bacterium]
MSIFITIVHVLTSLLIIAAVLLQSGKGAETGVMIGGSSQSMFGARGATPFLSKVTVVLATIFMVTSLSLALLKQNPVGSSLLLNAPIKALPAPEVPAKTPVASAPAKKP